MTEQRRAFNSLPDYLKTPSNDRETYILDDALFEPANASLINGYIGDVSNLSAIDLERKPQIKETTSTRQKYQLSLGGVHVDPSTEVYSGGAFYTDILGQIMANGGIITDPNRLFETSYYVWTPPIDYDKHINYSRYFWTGSGNATDTAEYILKEQQGSQTVIYKHDGTSYKVIPVTIGDTPTNPSIGTIWEDFNDDRTIKEWDGTYWYTLPITYSDDIPTSDIGLVYVGRTGPDFNRPLIWSFENTRWVARPVVVGPIPDSPVEGMIWEDATALPKRVFKIYQNGSFVSLSVSMGVPSGIPSSSTYIYDNRSTNIDAWSEANYWRHYNDLSPTDRAKLGNSNQAIRPIVEFWAGLETGNAIKTGRNVEPNFKIYAFNGTEITDASHDSTIFQYMRGTGTTDSVMGFPLNYNATGEFQFELTLETDTVSATGYKYFKDTQTGKVHGIWAKSTKALTQTKDSNGDYSLPKSMTSNADHGILTTFSRGKILPHMLANIAAQTNLSGNQNGVNNYRWLAKSYDADAAIIDPEHTSLKILGTLQRNNLNIPDVIRFTGNAYERTLSKFMKKLNTLWDAGQLSDAAGTTYFPANEIVDVICSQIFIGRNSEFRYHYSEMGTYTERQISGTTTKAVSGNHPIYIPSSPQNIGAVQTYKPAKFTDHGTDKLRGHDGSVIPAFGDARDDVWLDLQNRFYDAVKTNYKDETSTYSSNHVKSNFRIGRYYGGSSVTITHTVDAVVQDYTAETKVAGKTWFDTSRAEIVSWTGIEYTTKSARTDDVIFETGTSKYHIFNGLGTYEVPQFSNGFTFDYSSDDFRRIMRREFERWAITRDIDFVTNTDFDSADKFTWNYRSAGFEGNYRGIYNRLYRTVRPHLEPWAILGYSIEPSWWRTEYVPTSTATDGSPRYANTHAMWNDIQNGKISPTTTDASFKMAAPIPVDANGELLDPIAAGIIKEEALDKSRISSSWIYGDGAPAEQAFIESLQYPFSITLASYLMKPVKFVDTIWSQLYINVGDTGALTLHNAPHIVHKDSYTRPSTSTLKMHLETENNTTVIRIGLNSWISEYISQAGLSPSSDFGDIIRNTKVSLAWQCSGFINKQRTTLTTIGGLRVPFEDVHTMLHKSEPTKEIFGSGVMIQRDGSGYKIYGYDLFNPYFEVDLPAIPRDSGQVEKKENITATKGQTDYVLSNITLPLNDVTDTGAFTILKNGLALDNKYITVNSKTTFTIDGVVAISDGDIISVVTLSAQTNLPVQVKQFAVNGVYFPYMDVGQGVTEVIEYGRYFGTQTEVINFLLGYGRKLKSDGWVFGDETHIEGALDWMDGAKAFATWVLETTKKWESTQDLGYSDTIFFFSPFVKGAKFNSTFGQVLNTENSLSGAYGIIDAYVNPIPPKKIFTARVGNTLEMTVDSGTPDMYGIRLQVVEYQHTTFISNVTKFGDVIYDPVLGNAISILGLEAYRSNNWDGTLRASGFIVDDTDILPNFEKKTKDISGYYDRTNPNDDPVIRDMGRELYGWSQLDKYADQDGNTSLMMDAIGADDKARFDYHRGMIQSKGTMKPLIAFGAGTRLNQDNINIAEDWAWRLEEYGDTRKNIIQFTVNSSDFKSVVQPIKFNVVAKNTTDKSIQFLTYDYASPEAAWIIPPSIGGSGTTVSYTMPTVGSKTVMSAIMYDGDTRSPISRLFEFDPANDVMKNDPDALSVIDHIIKSDPAQYNMGDGAAYSNGSVWNDEQVGRYWWDTTRAKYMNYRGHLPDYNKAGRDWGVLKYFTGAITRTDATVTVTTYDPHTGQLGDHGLSTGDTIKISGADQTDYNVEVAVTVTGNNTFTFQTNGVPNTPATGDIRVQVGFIDMYEWVKSPVPPTAWADYVKNINSDTSNGDASTSYVEIISYDANNKKHTDYYFWVKNNTGINATKSLNYKEVVDKLAYAHSNASWISNADTNTLLIHMGGVIIEDGYVLELCQDDSNFPMHTDWALISENPSTTATNSAFGVIPKEIIDKITDCLAGVDSHGNVVPNSHLVAAEKYGTSVYPAQTIFKDRNSALTIFVNKTNEILSEMTLKEVNDLTTIFPIADENSYWKRASYVNQSYSNKAVYDTVVDDTVRDSRLSDGLYIDGDIVEVLAGIDKDLWDGTQTTSRYVVANGQFTQIGSGGQTLSIILDSTSSSSVIRSTIGKVFGLLDTVSKNRLIFAVLYEMLRQSPNADWFIKTSYVSAHITDNMSYDNFKKPSHSDALLSALLETKPYRTKLRDAILSYDVGTIDNMNVSLVDSEVTKITLMFDRLNSYLEDENSWDGPAWDTHPYGWDRPIWDLENEGIDHWISGPLVSGIAGQSEYTIPAMGDATKYQNRITLYVKGVKTDMASIGLSYSLVSNHANVVVTFGSPLNSDYTFTLDQTVSFYNGGTPVLPTDAPSLMQPAPSTFKHQTARMAAIGYPLTGNNDERIDTTSYDMMTMTVKEDWTSALGAWDAAPWDTTPFDTPPVDKGRRIFFQMAGKQASIAAGAEVISTAENTTITATNLAKYTSAYHIGRIDVNGNTLASMDYVVHPDTRTIEFLPKPPLEYTANGVNTSFSISSLTKPLKDVRRNGILQVLGTDYTVSGTNIVFNQPAASVINKYASLNATYKLADGSNAFFVNQPSGSLNVDNMFVFVNGKLQPSTAYYLNNGKVSFTTTPAAGDDVMIWAFGNPYSDNHVFLAPYTATGDGATTTYPIGMNATQATAYVYVNGVYQVFGVDYTMLANGSVVFTTAPANGASIDIRRYDPTQYVSIDNTHLVLTASGAATDNITGITDADPNYTMIYVNGVLQDGHSTSPTYYLSNGNPDVITWVTPPAAGAKITIRLVRKVAIAQTTQVTVLPLLNDVISITQNTQYPVGDTVKIFYDRFPIPPLHDVTINSVPTTYDVVNGELVLDNFVDSTLTITHKVARKAPHGLGFAVRMPIIVDEAWTNHLLYDAPLGFETNRAVGKIVLNTTNNTMYSWNGTAWTTVGTVAAGNDILIRAEQRILNFNGASYTETYAAGGAPTLPPTFNYPTYGKGIISGTYALGQLVNAATDFPEAYNVMQFAGDY